MNILIIGATSGIGTPLIRRLQARGYMVTGTVRTSTQASTLRRDHPGIEVFLLDLSNADTIHAALHDGLGGSVSTLDAVVVCAGTASYGELETQSLVEIRQSLEVNAICPLAIFQSLLPHLRETRGRFVFVSSYAGKVTSPFLGAYQASKATMESLGDSMRQEARHSNVDVSLVLPGGIDTPMCSNMLESIEQDIAKLNPMQEQLYGHYYRGQREMLLNASLLDPDVVAAVIDTAIEAALPETRYVVGEDAAYLIARKSELNDREMDEFVELFFHP